MVDLGQDVPLGGLQVDPVFSLCTPRGLGAGQVGIVTFIKRNIFKTILCQDDFTG